MQTTLDTSVASPINQVDAQRAGSAYVAAALGADYGTASGFYRHGRWHFLVRCNRAGGKQPCIVGRLSVEAATGRVNELTVEQIREMQESGVVQAAQARGELARDEQGYVLRSQARIKASVWISDRVDLKVGANGGAFLPLDPPVWRFSIDFHLGERFLDPLGVIDVEATTGQVVPLSDEQIQAIQECVRAAKRLQTLAPAI
jgi:hypothetical protein